MAKSDELTCGKVPTEKYDTIITKTREEHSAGRQYPNEHSTAISHIYTDEIAKLDNSEKIEFLIYCVEQTRLSVDIEWNGTSGQSENNGRFFLTYLRYLFRSKIILSSISLQRIIEAIYRDDSMHSLMFADGNISILINQFSKQQKNRIPDKTAHQALSLLRKELVQNGEYYSRKEKEKVLKKIEDILAENARETGVRPVLFLGEDNFTPVGNGIIESLPPTERVFWYELMAKNQKATGSKPPGRYISQSKEIIALLGPEKFKKTVLEFFIAILDLNEIVEKTNWVYSEIEYVDVKVRFLSTTNTEALKGFVWMCALFPDPLIIQTVAKLANRCFKKIPHKGPASVGLGNACLYTLANLKGLEGISELSKLRLTIKQSNSLKLIDHYIHAIATRQGLTISEIEDLAVDDFKLKGGKREWNVAGFTAVLEIAGVGKSTLKWLRGDDKQQNTVPAIVKDEHSATLKKIKEVQKQIDQATRIQRERFDRMLRTNREVSLKYFKERYLNHGLLGWITANIIFTFSNGDRTVQAIRSKNKWFSATGDEIDINQYKRVSLWHPVTSTKENVKLWRDYLTSNKVLQPFKQAFREIYLLTEAEINTRTYSNRMASHILKQHQYVSLARSRSWKAKLISSFAEESEDTACLSLPDYNLKAEYWVYSLNTNGAFSGTGIWTYVTTDQIRFIDTRTNEILELIGVPAIPFSETMRDIDLFVGVASVGNDPLWQDSGGVPMYGDYWHSYSFGDLSEIAKNRKEILTNLIPRLNIANVTSIQGRFVVVQGKLRTYKIHIGSTNILMEPNDQYLCIVPERSMKYNTENIYLPFLGDAGLSVILSKAFLLAADDQITDSTIISQIKKQ